MSAINAETRDAWQAIANDLSAQRPSAGKRVRVTAGRKQGREGTVTCHMVSRYGNPFRYGGDASLHMREMAGRYGFVCRVRDDAGAEFWIDAAKVLVLGAQE